MAVLAEALGPGAPVISRTKMRDLSAAILVVGMALPA